MRPAHVFIDSATWHLRRSDRRYGLLPPYLDKAVLWRNRAALRKLTREASARLEWMIYYERHGKNALQTARHYGIAPKTFWKWRKRFREDDLATLEEFSRIPLNKRTRTITQQEEVQLGNMIPDVEEFNRRLTEWLIEYNFKRPHQALGYSTPINFIYKREPSLVLPMCPSSTFA